MLARRRPIGGDADLGSPESFSPRKQIQPPRQHQTQHAYGSSVHNPQRRAAANVLVAMGFFTLGMVLTVIASRFTRRGWLAAPDVESTNENLLKNNRAKNYLQSILPPAGAPTPDPHEVLFKSDMCFVITASDPERRVARTAASLQLATEAFYKKIAPDVKIRSLVIDGYAHSSLYNSLDRKEVFPLLARTRNVAMASRTSLFAQLGVRVAHLKSKHEKLTQGGSQQLSPFAAPAIDLALGLVWCELKLCDLCAVLESETVLTIDSVSSMFRAAKRADAEHNGWQVMSLFRSGVEQGWSLLYWGDWAAIASVLLIEFLVLRVALGFSPLATALWMIWTTVALLALGKEFWASLFGYFYSSKGYLKVIDWKKYDPSWGGTPGLLFNPKGGRAYTSQLCDSQPLTTYNVHEILADTMKSSLEMVPNPLDRIVVATKILPATGGVFARSGTFNRGASEF